MIRSLNNLTKAFVLFVKNTNDSLRLCVNYRDFNEITTKNKYLLSLLSETLDCFTHARYFTKINILYVMHIIAFEFIKTMNEKQHFVFAMINLNIRLCRLNS